MATNKKKESSNVTGGWPCGLALTYDVLATVRLFNQAYNKYQKSGAQVLKSMQLTFAQVMESQGLKPMQLTFSQVNTVLALSYVQKPMTLTELSPFLPIETASVSLVIDSLQKAKLIQRRHSRTDRRKIFITLTPAGKELVDMLWPPIFNLVTDMFCKNLTDEERQLLMNILRKIRDSSYV
ncbi:MAG: MarR family transcriptional regulator [Dehalococcoidia bacterium]|nr:MAG: MarR family transcriptional regulator [Dehalococcoidia bacterium]